MVTAYRDLENQRINTRFEVVPEEISGDSRPDTTGISTSAALKDQPDGLHIRTYNAANTVPSTAIHTSSSSAGLTNSRRAAKEPGGDTDVLKH